MYERIPADERAYQAIQHDQVGSVRTQRVLQAMTAYGGSFVHALAQAWRCADQGNHERLLKAFVFLYKQYDEMALEDERRNFGQTAQKSSEST